MRAIPPTLKDTPRYAYIPNANRSTFKELYDRYESLFGTVESARSRLLLVSCEKGGMIVRVAHDRIVNLRIACLSIRGIGIARISGTLNKLRTKYINELSRHQPNEQDE